MTKMKSVSNYCPTFPIQPYPYQNHFLDSLISLEFKDIWFLYENWVIEAIAYFIKPQRTEGWNLEGLLNKNVMLCVQGRHE